MISWLCKACILVSYLAKNWMLGLIYADGTENLRPYRGHLSNCLVHQDRFLTPPLVPVRLRQAFRRQDVVLSEHLSSRKQRTPWKNTPDLQTLHSCPPCLCERCS